LFCKYKCFEGLIHYSKQQYKTYTMGCENSIRKVDSYRLDGVWFLAVAEMLVFAIPFMLSLGDTTLIHWVLEFLFPGTWSWPLTFLHRQGAQLYLPHPFIFQCHGTRRTVSSLFNLHIHPHWYFISLICEGLFVSVISSQSDRSVGTGELSFNTSV
jgi:hypothetical protein